MGGLKEGSIDNPKECKKIIEKVIKLVQNCGADEALVKTLPQILRRKPEERGNFDEMALQQLDSYIMDHLVLLSNKIEAADKIIGGRVIKPSMQHWLSKSVCSKN